MWKRPVQGGKKKGQVGGMGYWEFKLSYSRVCKGTVSLIKLNTLWRFFAWGHKAKASTIQLRKLNTKNYPRSFIVRSSQGCIHRANPNIRDARKKSLKLYKDNHHESLLGDVTKEKQKSSGQFCASLLYQACATCATQPARCGAHDVEGFGFKLTAIRCSVEASERAFQYSYSLKKSDQLRPKPIESSSLKRSSVFGRPTTLQ